MSRRNPRATILSVVDGDPVIRRDTYDVKVGDRSVRMFHGDSVLVGTEGDGNGPTAVSLAVLLPACTCGCNASGRGIEFIPTPEHARMLAAQLIEAADAVEAHAKVTAADFLGRVLGGSADR